MSNHMRWIIGLLQYSDSAHKMLVKMTEWSSETNDCIERKFDVEEVNQWRTYRNGDLFLLEIFAFSNYTVKLFIVGFIYCMPEFLVEIWSLGFHQLAG